MRTVANLAQVIGSEPNYRAPVEKAQISDNATKLVDRMFQRLKALHPAWKQAFATTEDYNYAKQIWLEELLKAGVVTPLKLKRGLDIAATQASAFFPSVGQFIAWCNITDYSTLGLPTPDELPARVSKFQAVYCTDGEDKFNYLSDAEYWLLTDLCSRGRRDQWTPAELKKECEQALKAMAKRIESGETIPARRRQLPAQTTVPTSPEKTAENIAKIKQILGMKK